MRGCRPSHHARTGPPIRTTGHTVQATSQKSRAAYDKAIELAGNTAETAYLTRRRDQLR
jgi:RNA polymerase sigma-70 factor, ECF subfamily